MKKVFLFLIVLFLFPIMVFARTPNQEETLNVIRGISNVTVIDGVTIDSTTVDDENVIFSIFGFDNYVPYIFNGNDLAFYGGYVLLDENNKVINDPFDNEYAFFLYSILENKSAIPYDFNNYYSTDNIKEMINNGFSTEYKESSNTFGITLRKDEGQNNKYQIVYHYYLDGDYPILELDLGTSEFTNPATGNYSVLVTIMLVSVLCIGLYSYVNREKRKN